MTYPEVFGISPSDSDINRKLVFLENRIRFYPF